MARLLRISIYAVIILILYFWITSIIQTYSDKNKITNEITSTDTIPVNDSYEDINSFDNLDTSVAITNEDIVGGGINYDAVDKKLKSLKETENTSQIEKQPGKISEDQPLSDTKSNPAQKVEDQPIKNTKINEIKTKINTPQNPKKPEIGDGGQFMVMAGSYLLKENAEKMVTKLKNMGFSNAKTVIFSSSQYHSVVAAQHTSQAKAQESAADLKRKGIDSFVKTKN